MTFIKISLFFIFCLFFLTPKNIYAQLNITSFDSNGSPDWVEVKNQSDTDINFSEYYITDVAGNEIRKELVIPAKSNCVFDYFNRLNNSGDTIYLYKNDQQIDCVKYADSAGGQCDKSFEPISEKPASNCYTPTPTPDPTQTPTPTPTPTSTPTPTPKATNTPTPTKIATPKSTPTPISTNNEIAIVNNLESADYENNLEDIDESDIKSASHSSEVLSVFTQKPEPKEDPVDEVVEEKNNKFVPKIFMFLGTGSIFTSIAWFVFQAYNKKYFENSPFN